MESLFRTVGIYSSVGQHYEPVDVKRLLYYKEAKDGQILEEGITEAGSMASFIAAGTAYASHGINTIPVLHLLFDVWIPAHRRFHLGRRRHARAADSCSAALPAAPRLPAKACSTRTATATCWRCPFPTSCAYDPAYAYEIAVIVQDGIRRMYKERRKHLLLHHRDERAVRHARHAQGTSSRAFSKACTGTARPPIKNRKLRAQLFGSGAILNEALQAAADPGKELRRGRRCLERHQLQMPLHAMPSRRSAGTVCIPMKLRASLTSPMLAGRARRVRRRSDYLKTLPRVFHKWVPRRIAVARHRWFRPQ